MNVDRRRLFEHVEPPAGGVERMRRRLERGPRPIVGLRPAALVAACLVVAGAALLALWAPWERPSPAGTVYEAPELDRLLGRESRPRELQVSVNGRRVEAVAVARADSKVRIYELE